MEIHGHGRVRSFFGQRISAGESTRLKLLPIWLRLLCCLCLVFLVLPILFPLVVLSESWSCHLYWLSYTGPPLTAQALAMAFGLLLHGVAAYGLLWSRDWGPALGILVCGIGLAIYVVGFVASELSDVEPAPVVLILVLLTLLRVRRRWAEIGTPQPPPSGEHA